MHQVDTDRQAALESAVRLWNARAGGVYQEARVCLREAQEHLDQVLAYLARRRPLDADAVRSALGSGGEASRRVLALEDALAAYHVELQTLQAQAERTVEAGHSLAVALRGLQDADAEPIPAPPHRDASGAREAALSAEIAGLARELEATRAALHAAQAAPRALPKAAQEELIRLREEVVELRESKLEGPAPLPALDSNSRLRQEALDEQGNRRPLGMILVKAGIITADQLDDALREQRSAWNRHLGALLVDLGFTSEEVIAQTLAAQLQAPYTALHPSHIDTAAARLITPQMAQHHTCIPMSLDGQRLKVAMANPMDLIAQEDVRLATGLDIEVVVATATAIRNAMRRVFVRR